MIERGAGLLHAHFERRIVLAAVFLALVFLGLAVGAPVARGKGHRTASGRRAPEPKYDPFVSWIPGLERDQLWVMPLPAFSPDRQMVAYFDRGPRYDKNQLQVYSTKSESIKWIYRPTGGQGASGYGWSPDSKKLAVSTYSSVVILDAGTGKKEIEYQGLAPDVFAPEWSPDGRLVAFCGRSFAGRIGTVQVWEPSTGKVAFEVSNGAGSSVRWSPDSSRIAFNGPGIEIWSVGQKSRVLKLDVARRGNSPFAWSPDGKWLVVGDFGTAEATVFDATTGARINRHKFDSIHEIDWLAPDLIRCIDERGGAYWKVPLDSKGDVKAIRIPDVVLGMKGYIPKNLEECFRQLDAELPAKTIRKIKNTPENELAGFHLGLGMWMRNEWGLRSGSDLARYFAGLKVRHAEDMSGIIIDSYWRRLHGLPLKVEDQVKTYSIHWEKHRQQQELEKKRAGDARTLIQKGMLGLSLLGKPEDKLEIPALPGDGLRARYVARYGKNILMTAMEYEDDQSGFSTPPYLVDLEAGFIHPIRVAELDSIKSAVCVNGAVYLHGVRGKAERILAISEGSRKILEAPPGDGWLSLGQSMDTLLAVRPHAIFELRDGAWKRIHSSVKELPRGGVPPESMCGRIFFRDEGRGGNSKRLSWVGAEDPKELTHFDEDVGVVGQEGPRWENVSSFTCMPDAKLWICAGEFSNSLLVFSGQDGYKIATMNNQLGFDGNLLGHGTWGGIPEGDIAITVVLRTENTAVLALGPTGLYSIDGSKLTWLLQFTNSLQDTATVKHLSWTPTHVIPLGPDDYFIGAHWGGTLRLRRNARGKFAFELLDAKLGKPVRL